MVWDQKLKMQHQNNTNRKHNNPRQTWISNPGPLALQSDHYPLTIETTECNDCRKPVSTFCIKTNITSSSETERINELFSPLFSGDLVLDLGQVFFVLLLLQVDLQTQHRLRLTGLDFHTLHRYISMSKVNDDNVWIWWIKRHHLIPLNPWYIL